jgi:hypothetical protein
MAELKRHVGKLLNSDRRCVIVYMQIPGRETHALIVDTDSLPDQFHQALMDVVESDPGQNTQNLAEVLDRRASPDAGSNLMNSFHQRGFLRAERVENIIMLPKPNAPYPLVKIIESMNKNKRASIAVEQQDVDFVEKYNQHTANLKVDNLENKLAIAQSILYDAKLLEEEVIRKKNQAYNMMPSLRPSNSPNSPNSSNRDKSTITESLQEYDQAEVLSRAQEHITRALEREQQGLDVIIEPINNPVSAKVASKSKSRK